MRSLVKMNKMIHKKTGASFLVTYIIYVSLVIARKLCHVYSPDMPSLQLLEGKLKRLLVCIQVGLYLFHYVLDNLNWLLFVFLSNLIINLMYNIKKLYFNDRPAQVQSLKTMSIKLDKKV